MSILSDLDAMVLRDTSNPPLTDKGSELTYAEFDGNFVKLYDAVQSIVSGQGVTAYDAGATYDMFGTSIYEKFASYDGRIWKASYVGSPSSFSGQTPAEGIYWTQVTLAEVFPDVLKVVDKATNSSYLKEATLTIASADVLQLNTTPLTIVSAVSGKAIEVISAVIYIDYNSIAYSTNIRLILITDGADVDQCDNTIDATVSRIGKFRLKSTSGESATDTQLILNADLLVSVADGDPTDGNSDITIKVIYREIEF